MQILFYQYHVKCTGLNTSTNISLAEWFPKKHNPTISSVKDVCFKHKVKGQKNIFHANYQNRAGVAILILKSKTLRTQIVTRDKEHLIIV